MSCKHKNINLVGFFNHGVLAQRVWRAFHPGEGFSTAALLVEALWSEIKAAGGLRSMSFRISLDKVSTRNLAPTTHNPPIPHPPRATSPVKIAGTESFFEGTETSYFAISS